MAISPNAQAAMNSFVPGGPPGGVAGGGPQDEVGQLLALREQIDQRLAELTGGAGMPQVAGGVPAPMPMDAAMPPGLLA